eukprot:CAMPEP_0201500316 /NCGR_PEP_ID=MMETSP0151_2-20130828/80824_1 /ASSEMBLY_ACC=CAM_ASM_000257 /TAXON_ID=200890 /ORGANISM="Paramoeba atlantica, Strain 621/1 / CCAP 1560/9" /LENGTH=295 /DNA_ID=CAMNT_0047893449 /DNA_START=78 /DNA_END=965 /DNA_ORIENTATION=+
MADELLEIRTNFYIGNYQFVINEAENISSPNPSVNEEKRLLVYRSHLALQNYSFVLDEVDDSSPEELQITKLLALYLSEEDVMGARNGFSSHMKKPSVSDVATQFLFLASGLFFFHEGDLEEALKAVSKCTGLEGKALMTQIYLHMNRFDTAEKETKQMQTIDDDSVITQLSQAWVYASMGGEKANQASYIFDELIEKYGSTSLLLTGQAVCKMACEQFVEAEPLLLQALEKAPNDKNALISLAVCSRHLGKPVEVVNRKVKQVKSMGGARHGWITNLDHHDQLFDTACARFKFD